MTPDGLRDQYIIATMFIRDDYERFALGVGNYQFKEKQLMFAEDSVASDIVNVQGGDGVLLAGQVLRAGTQTFEGFVGSPTSTKADIETYRQAFLSFFRLGHFYDVVFILPSGNAYHRTNGFIVNAPTVQELRQINPEYSVGFNFENVDYEIYAEGGD